MLSAAAAAALRCFFIIKGNELRQWQRQRCCCVTALSSVSQPLLPPSLTQLFDKHYTQDIAFAFYTLPNYRVAGYYSLVAIESACYRQKEAWHIPQSIYSCSGWIDECMHLCLSVPLLYVFCLCVLFLSVCLSVCRSSVRLFVCPSIYLSVCLSFICLSSVYLSVLLSVSLSVCLPVCLYAHLYLRDYKG